MVDRKEGMGSAIMAAAILTIWTDIPADIEADFNEWYNREHLPDRVQRTPGFLRGIASAAYAIGNAEVMQAFAAKDDRAGDRYLENILVIEAASEQGVGTAMRFLDAANLASAGGRPHLLAAPCALRILYTLHAPAPALQSTARCR